MSIGDATRLGEVHAHSDSTRIRESQTRCNRVRNMQTDPEMLSTAAFAGLVEFVPARPGAACPIKQKAKSGMAK